VKNLVDNLERIIDCDLEEASKNLAKIFLAAVNDWPDSVTSLKDYVFQVEAFINNQATKLSLTNHLKRIDLNKDGWRAESIAEVLLVYHFFDEKLSLKDIVLDFEKILWNL
jgi:hypothetical protein